MANTQDVAEIMALLAAAYPHFVPTEHTVEVYFRTLQDLPADELKVATLHCIAEAGRKFAPTVGELRGAVTEVRIAKVNLPSAYEAWQEVITQLSINGGDFGRPEWSNPLVERAVKLIGWRNLRMSEDQTADRARFVMAYEQLVQRATRDDMLLPEVRGYIETAGGRLLSPMDQITQLAGKLKA